MYHGHVAVAQLFATGNVTSSTVHGITSLSQNSRPIGPSSLFSPRQVQPSASVSMETATLEDIPPLDAIPSLSLPPPVLPFRVYGHNYLDKKPLMFLRVTT